MELGTDLTWPFRPFGPFDYKPESPSRVEKKMRQILFVDQEFIAAGHEDPTNQKEFFAEMTEGFIGTNDFFPFNGAELLTAEPEVFHLMRDAWGPISRTK